MKFVALAVASLLLSANAFAAPQDAPSNMPSISQEDGLTLIEVGGQKFTTISEVNGQKAATIYLEGQPKDTQLFVTSDSVTYDDKAHTATVKGKFTIGVLQQGKRLWQISLADGAGKIESTVSVRLVFKQKQK